MTVNKLIKLVAFTFIAALLFSGTVFAEGEEPAVPAEPAPVVVEISPDEPSVDTAVAPLPAAPVAPVDDLLSAPAQNQNIPVEAALPVIEIPPVETVAESVSAVEEPVLADASGEPLDLASQQSAELISSGDPYWFVGAQKYATIFTAGTCPAGTTYGLTCWDDPVLDNPINKALERIETLGLLPTDRKIYVLSGSYYESISIDGSLSGDAIKSQLKGMIGNPDGTGIPSLYGNITLLNMTGGFTLSGFNINGGVEFENTGGAVLLKDLTVRNTSGKGIAIGNSTTSHVGSVTLQNVISSDNNQIGAELYVSGGILKINNSAFDLNDDGLCGGGIYPVCGGLFANIVGGAITLDGVSASKNAGYGVDINYFNKPLVIKNSVFSNNSSDGYGLAAYGYATAPITLDTVIALKNDQYGIYLDNYGAMTLNNIIASDSVKTDGMKLLHSGRTPVKVSNGTFDSNGVSAGLNGTGLKIYSQGPVTLTSIQAENNWVDGVYVDNCDWDGLICRGTGSVIITSPTVGGAMAANDFYQNRGSGIKITSNGSVTLTNFNSIHNQVHGVYIDTQYGNGSQTINETLPDWYNDVSLNDWNGIYVNSKGSITLSGTSASKNGWNGFRSEDSAKNISISGGTFNTNGWNGLDIRGNGNITLTDVEASDNDTNHADANYYNGAVITNTTGSVTVKSTNKATYFNYSGNSLHGLSINTSGKVLISNISADKNVEDGIYLVSGNGTVGLARIQAGGNGLMGIDMTAYGNVTFDSVSASSNGTYGAFLYMCRNDGLSGCLNNNTFTLKGAGSAFDYNTLYGLYVQTRGNVSLTNVSATGNKYAGIDIYNIYANSLGNVSIGSTGGYWNTIEGNNSSRTDLAGLVINTYGSITLTRVKVLNNYRYGAILSNAFSTLHKAITLTDCYFDSNEDYGVVAESAGAVAMRGVSASYNSPHNGEIAVVGSLTGGTTIYDMLTSDTDGDRWWFTGTMGDTYHVHLDSDVFDVYLELYSEDGILINSDDDAGGGTNAYFQSTFPASGRYYLKVSSYTVRNGAYVLRLNDDLKTNEINYKVYTGAYIYNTPGIAGVTLTNTANVWPTFNENNYSGLIVNSKGAVALANLSASKNYWNGVYVGTDGNVSITNNSSTIASEFNLNGNDGLAVVAKGTITVNNHIFAQENYYNGINLANIGALTAKNVTVGKVIVDTNGNIGLMVYSNGNIALSNITAQNNVYHGVGATNNYMGGSLTISGSNTLSFNGYNGLYVLTDGTVSISGVLAEYNDWDGIFVQDGGAGKTVLVKTTTVRFNKWHGLQIFEAYGKITLNTVKAFYNGIGSDLDGVNLHVHDDNDVLVQNCVFMANEGNGLELNIGTGTLTVTGSSIIGNDTNGNGDENIVVY